MVSSLDKSLSVATSSAVTLRTPLTDPTILLRISPTILDSNP